MLYFCSRFYLFVHNVNFFTVVCYSLLYNVFVKSVLFLFDFYIICPHGFILSTIHVLYPPSDDFSPSFMYFVHIYVFCPLSDVFCPQCLCTFITYLLNFYFLSCSQLLPCTQELENVLTLMPLLLVPTVSNTCG